MTAGDGRREDEGAREGGREGKLEIGVEREREREPSVGFTVQEEGNIWSRLC